MFNVLGCSAIANIFLIRQITVQTPKQEQPRSKDVVKCIVFDEIASVLPFSQCHALT